MKCEQVKKSLSEYIDRELTPDQIAEVEDHLETCPDCRRELEELRKTVETIRKLPEEKPPPGFAANVLGRIQKTEKAKIIPSASKERFWPRALAVAAMFLLVVGVTMLLEQNGLLAPAGMEEDQLAFVPPGKKDRAQGLEEAGEIARKEIHKESERIMGKGDEGAKLAEKGAGLDEVAHPLKAEAPAPATAERKSLKKSNVAAKRSTGGAKDLRKAEGGWGGGGRAKAGSEPPDQVLTIDTEEPIQLAQKAIELAGTNKIRNVKLVFEKDRDKNEAVTLVVPVPAERYETFLNELSLLIPPARQRLSAVGESEGDVFLRSVTKRFQKRLLRRGPREKEKVSGTGDSASLEDEKADGGKVEEERDAELAAEQKRVEPTRSGLTTGVAVQQFERRPQKVKLVIRLNRLDKGYAAGAAEEDAEKKAHPPAMGF